MSALSDARVGDYLKRHFVSAVQKVGTFQIIDGVKVGGNVAGYFCTADGLVLQAFAGPVDADTFLREARWANDNFHLADLDKGTPAQLRASFRQAHVDRLQAETGIHVPDRGMPDPEAVDRKLLERLLLENQHFRLNNQRKINLLLAVAPLPRLSVVYPVVFESILNQKISTNPVAVAGR